MAQRLYLKGNYIIADDNGSVQRFPVAFTVIQKETTTVSIQNTLKEDSLGIPDAEAGNWLDSEAGSNPYTAGTLLDFLLANTGNFSLASGSGASIGDTLEWDGDRYVPVTPTPASSLATADQVITDNVRMIQLAGNSASEYLAIERANGNDLLQFRGDMRMLLGGIDIKQGATGFMDWIMGGALNTDGFRFRNSADSADLLAIRGGGIANMPAGSSFQVGTYVANTSIAMRVESATTNNPAQINNTAAANSVGYRATTSYTGAGSTTGYQANNTAAAAGQVKTGFEANVSGGSLNYAINILAGDINTPSGVGLSATYTFGGGGSGDIATMTFDRGILTGVTTNP